MTLVCIIMRWLTLLGTVVALATLPLDALAATCWRDTQCNGPSEAAFKGTYYIKFALHFALLIDQGLGTLTSTLHHREQSVQGQFSPSKTVIQQAIRVSSSSAATGRMSSSISVLKLVASLLSHTPVTGPVLSALRFPKRQHG